MQGLLKARVNSASLTPAGGQVPSRTQQTTRNKTQLSTQRLEETQSDGTSLVGQWLRLHTPNAAGLRLLPGQGTRWLTSGSDSRICLQCRRRGFNPWVGKIPRRRAWQPTPVFLPGEPHGQRSLAGHSPGVAESDATERLSRSTEQALGRSESCCGASQLTPDSADGRSKAQRGCVAALGLRSWHVEDRGLETLPLLTRVMCLLYQAA